MPTRPLTWIKKYESYKDKLPLSQYLDWTREWLTEASRILTPGGALFLYNIPKLLTYSSAILNELLDFRHWIAWNSGGKPLGKTLQPAHYGILFYTKGGITPSFTMSRPPPAVPGVPSLR